MTDGILSLVGGARRIEARLVPTESISLDPADVTPSDDALLDSWLASLTPDRFERILDALARPLGVSVASAG